MNSLHSLSTAELQSLGMEQMGSHALQALITLSSDKGKGKILRKLEVRQQKSRDSNDHHSAVTDLNLSLISVSLMQGLYTQLACSRYGSRLLEAVWSSATLSQKQNIAEQLGELTTSRIEFTYLHTF